MGCLGYSKNLFNSVVPLKKPFKATDIYQYPVGFPLTSNTLGILKGSWVVLIIQIFLKCFVTFKKAVYSHRYLSVSSWLSINF